MKKLFRLDSRQGTAWYQVVLAFTAFLLLANGGPASAGGDDAALDFVWAETYAGVFAGYARMNNRIVDVDGFANWGHPGSGSNYNDDAFAGGVLVGKKFRIEGVPFRIEVDGTFGDLSATTNTLDPEGLDETAKAEFHWNVTTRIGLEYTLGRTTVFTTGGLAIARIANSVTDMDFLPDSPLTPPPTRVDPDDSFRDSSTEIGWVIGAGVETPLADDWILRLEGSYLDFGSSTYDVNRSANNPCGPGNPRRPCPYRVENNLALVRLALIYPFSW